MNHVKVLLLSLITFTAAHAAEVEVWHCPYENDANKLEKLDAHVTSLLSGGSLEAAAELASDCANYGSSIDVSILSPVANAFEDKLETLLKDKPEARAAKEAMTAACWKKYEDEGTLGRAMAAHCSLKVLVGFEAAFSPAFE